MVAERLDSVLHSLSGGLIVVKEIASDEHEINLLLARDGEDLRSAATACARTHEHPERVGLGCDGVGVGSVCWAARPPRAY